MKIAFLGARGVGNTYSGIETYYEEVGSRLAARGHDVTAYCRTYFTPAVDTYRGIRVRRLPSLRSKHLETLSHSLLGTFDSLFRGFDLVQFHALGSAPLALVPRLLGIPTVVSVRGLDWQRAKWSAFARRALQLGEWASARCPTATVVVSETLQKHYAEAHGRTPWVIPNAVIPVEPAPARRILERGLVPGGFWLFAGRISPEKGLDTLLEALRPLPRDRPLVIAGGSSYSDDYVETVRAAAWEEVVFLGKVDHDTMAELYSHCYAFILPSVMEGLSVALLEAVSYGCCIVTTAIPENLEVVGEAALTFPVGDVPALREQLARLAASPDLAAHHRRLAAERARERPDWDEVARRTEALYLQILDRGPGGAR